jgi:hypothetical protein
MKPGSSSIRLLWLSLLLFAAPDSRAAAPQLSAQASANGGAPFLSPTTGGRSIGIPLRSIISW